MWRGKEVITVGSAHGLTEYGENRARGITRAIARGDTQAFAVFFREHFDGMHAEARRVTGRDEAFCMDVVQNAMIRVIRHMKPLDSEQHLERWLKATVRSCAFDCLRHERRRRRREIQFGQRGTSPDDDELDQRLNWLRKEMAQLERSDVSVVAMRFQLGWTLQRIGAALGLKTGAVDARIRRIIARLRGRAPEITDD